MNTQGASSIPHAPFDQPPKPAAPTVGWFLRRSALWAGIVIAGVVFACALYAVGSSVGSDDVHASPTPADQPLKI